MFDCFTQLNMAAFYCLHPELDLDVNFRLRLLDAGCCARYVGDVLVSITSYGVPVQVFTGVFVLVRRTTTRATSTFDVLMLLRDRCSMAFFRLLKLCWYVFYITILLLHF